MRLRELRYLHTVAEDMYRAYTCRDWRRYLQSRDELREMMVRLDLKAQIDKHLDDAKQNKPTQDPGASPENFWGW